MLFWKIGGASFAGGLDWGYYLCGLGALVIMFLLSTLCIRLFAVTAYQAGSFSQSCYRFNTYIGVAVVLNSLGNEGIKYFGILIGLAIPVINLFAVSLLIWFSGQDLTGGQRLRITLKEIASNPLILACIAGIFYGRFGFGFPVFIDNTLSLVSMVALPLALISIGGSLTFAGVAKNLRLSLVAATLKLAVLPVIGYLLFSLFAVDPLPTKVGMIFLALPTSTAIYVLSSQLHSDTELASASIVISTVFSFLPLSIVLLL